MNSIEIYNTLLEELKKISIWCKSPSCEENFDIDKVYKYIFDIYNISMDFGFLSPIYTLVDTMCDSLRHGQRNIAGNYSVENGIHDLDMIINRIKTRDINLLEGDIKLKKKLEKL